MIYQATGGDERSGMKTMAENLGVNLRSLEDLLHGDAGNEEAVFLCQHYISSETHIRAVSCGQGLLDSLQKETLDHFTVCCEQFA